MGCIVIGRAEISTTDLAEAGLSDNGHHLLCCLRLLSRILGSVASE